MIWRSLKFGLKVIGLLFLLIVAMNLWNIFSPMFLPDAPRELPTFSSVESEFQKLAEARRAGPEAEAAFREQREQNAVFDNSLVIYYLLPLFLVWLLNSIARARAVSPMSIIATFTSIWLGFTLLIEGIGFAFDFVGPVFMALGLGLAALRYAPVSMMKLVFYLPRRLERALLDLLNDKKGWIAQRYGLRAARTGRALAFLLLAGDAAWILWSMCDGVDGDGTPGAFALTARALAVALGLTLFVRAHLHKHGDLFHPRDLLPRFERQPSLERRADAPTVIRRGRLRDDTPG